MESDVITLQELFKFQIDEVTRDGTIVGGLRPTGLRPTFLQKFEKRGIALPLGLFQAHEPVLGRGRRGGRPVKRLASLIVAVALAGGVARRRGRRGRVGDCA